MKVYGDSRSGNCYKIQLLLGLLGKQCEWKEVDILNGETHQLVDSMVQSLSGVNFEYEEITTQ